MATWQSLLNFIIGNMKAKTIRILVIFGTISIIGLVATQIFWLRNAIALHDRQFNHNVQSALLRVVNQVMYYSGDTTRLSEPVVEMENDFYLVPLTDHVNAAFLEDLLKKQFAIHHLDMDFEYSLFDCNTNNLTYAHYVAFDKKQQEYYHINVAQMQTHTVFPMVNKDQYYFIVHFPKKRQVVVGQLGFWFISSFMLLCVVLFFAYAMFVILKQKRLSEIQTDFINNVTHEFKTPLSTISISTEVLLQPSIIQTPERLTSYATIIQDEANRLKNQVERVLQMAKLDKQRIRLNKEETDIHPVIKQAVDNMRLTILNRNGRVELNLEAKESVLRIDKLHFTNIIYNLLDNALKYTDKDEPVIAILTRNVSKGIEIDVRDNGIGIAEDKIPYVFDKFYRVPTGNVHDVKGFGLGLNYVKLMTDAHYGQIKVTSKLGEGSVFTLFFPFKK